MTKLLMTGALSVLIFSGLSAATDQEYHKDMQKHYDSMQSKSKDLDANLEAIESAIAKVSDANTKAAFDSIYKYFKAKQKLEKRHNDFMAKSHSDWGKEQKDSDDQKDTKKDTKKDMKKEKTKK